MKESVAITKEADAKRGFSPTRSDKSVQYVRDAHERQLGSLRGVIGNIRRDGGKPSVDSIATELSNMPATGERASVLLALQRTHGNRYVQRVFSAARSSHAGEPAPRRTIDMLQEGEEVPERSSSIDEEAAAPPAAAPAPAPAPTPAPAPAAKASEELKSPSTPAHKDDVNDGDDLVAAAEVYLTYELKEQAITSLEKHLLTNPTDEKALALLKKAEASN
ncbi:MAG: hypothetical protein KAT90_11475 [Gammaproteobacteria bacterium]|nr:hypothetical protein [Gammaproteobacteria bacterium]